MKEHLKMADVFKVGVSDAGIKVRQNYIIEGVDDSFKPMEYAAHAINSHDELVAEVERLRRQLHFCEASRGQLIDQINRMKRYVFEGKYQQKPHL